MSFSEIWDRYFFVRGAVRCTRNIRDTKPWHTFHDFSSEVGNAIEKVTDRSPNLQTFLFPAQHTLILYKGELPF